jgi:hypothetical protein
MIIKNGDIVKEVRLIDDGSLDTVFMIDGIELRYDSEYIERTLVDGPTESAYERALEDYLDDLNNEEVI